MSGDRPEAAAERSEDRVRTGAQPAALDSGPCELCVGQEVALKAESPRHRQLTPARTATRQRRGRQAAHLDPCLRRTRRHASDPHAVRRSKQQKKGAEAPGVKAAPAPRKTVTSIPPRSHGRSPVHRSSTGRFSSSASALRPNGKARSIHWDGCAQTPLRPH